MFSKSKLLPKLCFLTCLGFLQGVSARELKAFTSITSLPVLAFVSLKTSQGRDTSHSPPGRVKERPGLAPFCTADWPAHPQGPRAPTPACRPLCLSSWRLQACWATENPLANFPLLASVHKPQGHLVHQSWRRLRHRGSRPARPHHPPPTTPHHFCSSRSLLPTPALGLCSQLLSSLSLGRPPSL